jgi:hypothetical protein
MKAKELWGKFLEKVGFRKPAENIKSVQDATGDKLIEIGRDQVALDTNEGVQDVIETNAGDLKNLKDDLAKVDTSNKAEVEKAAMQISNFIEKNIFPLNLKPEEYKKKVEEMGIFET